MKTEIEKYGSRNWSVREPDGTLIAVTVYRRGARKIAEILEGLPEPQKITFSGMTSGANEKLDSLGV